MKSSRRWILLLSSAIVAASMWFYVDRILVGYQVADAAAHDRPRGNLSDLYPRWLGARELLQHRRNPYSDDLTREIQEGYYGRVLDPARPNDPKDQQGFAYPVYVVFLLAPLTGLSFHTVQIFFHGLLIVTTAASVLLWLWSLRWKLPPTLVGAGMLLALGSIPAVQGIKLQQLTLLVAGLAAAAAACLTSGYLCVAGVFVALATIKPQLAWPLVAWFLIWSLAEWKQRSRFVVGFSATMLLLLAGSELVLPGWWRLFLQAIQHYHQYTQNESVLDQLVNWMFGRYGGTAFALVACVPVVLLLWRSRRALPEATGSAVALILALTVLIVPMYAPYNQVLLVPAILLCVREWRTARTSGSARILYAATGLALTWQWIASFALSVTWLVNPSTAQRLWKLPFYATFALPVLVFVLTLAVAGRRLVSLQAQDAAG